MARYGFLVALLGGMTRGEWYRHVDPILAMRPGLSIEWLLEASLAELDGIADTAARNQHLTRGGRCPLLR